MTAHRMDQETVERLLVGPVAGAQDGPEVLLRLLAAVRAAPRPHEFGGEAAALEAFRAARAGAPPVPSRRAERPFATSLLGAKVTLAALLAAATGGVALAAATGTLEVPVHGGGGGSTTTPATAGGRTPSPTTAPGASPTPAAGPSGAPSSPSSLAGLCITYRSRTGESPQRVLESPRFAELVTAAGGRDEVPGYCDRLLGGPDKPTASPAPPTGRPDGTPSARPPRLPSTPPVGGAPTTRPAGPSVNLATPAVASANPTIPAGPSLPAQVRSSPR